MAVKIGNFGIHIIEILSTILFIILALAAFLMTAYVTDAYQIVIQRTLDNPFLNVLFLLIFISVLLLVSRGILKIKRGKQILLILVCIWVFFGSLVWTYLSKSGPASDSGSIYYAVKQFARNDFSALAYSGSYFSVYPFQLGLAFFYEIIIRIAHSDNFHILQGVNAICLVICVISQYHLAGHFSPRKEKDKVQVYELLLTALCFPFIMYGSYIYGEIPSFAFVLFGSLMIILLLKQNKIWCGILGFVSIVMAMMVRENTLIFLIALGCILIIYYLCNWKMISTKKKCFSIIYFICMFTLSIQIIPIVQSSYATRSGTEINSGVPASDYLAMGLMEADGGPGGYNGYNFETFTETANYDSSVANQLGWKAYKERLKFFSTHLGYAVSFLGAKFVDQWINPGWAIFNSTYVSFGERFDIVECFFSGSLYQVAIDYMSNYQMVLYFLTAVFCVVVIKKKKGYEVETLFSHLFLLTAVGGAIFYLAWEASGRYVLPYAIWILPNAAGGLAVIEYLITRGIKKYVKK